eukprot:Lithocolla_globosa_v1_NODE_441_length_4050_cov_246.680100.p4 type:complete len:110 gc:universal NODE_441_length_4050_cov_246.680100:3094-2765(-)
MRFHPTKKNETNQRIEIWNNLQKEWKENKKTPEPINARCIDLPDSTIYFNHHLSPNMSKCYFEARRLKKQDKLKFVWICKYTSKLFIKEKDENSPKIHVQATSDLDRFQ